MRECSIFHGAENFKKMHTQVLKTIMHIEPSGGALKAKQRALLSTESHTEGFRGHQKSLQI